MSKVFIFILIISLPYFTSLVGSAEEVKWTTKTVETLHSGDAISRGGFQLSAADFDMYNKFFLLTIYKNNTILKEDILGIGDTSTYNDEIKLVVIDVWSTGKGDSWVKAEVYLRAKPDMRISISTNRNEYNPQDTIATTVTLRNNGNDKIKNVGLNIDPGVLEPVGGSLKYDFNEIPSGQSKSVTIDFKAPLLAEAKYMTIGVNASGTDVKNINYSASASIKIKILQNRIIEMQKTLASSIYTDEVTSAYITIRNKGAINLNSIEVKDEIPDGFTSENDINLLWSLNLASGEEKRISYPLKPLLPGTYDVPAAQAQFVIDRKQYTVKSNTSRITVHAPLIVLTKTVDSAVAYISDQITVTINVRNDGDKQAMVKITDDLPSKADLLSGDLSWTSVLEKNESKSYTYTMKPNKAGELELPPAKANITYLQNSYNFTVSSRNLAVLVVESLDKKQIATSSPSIPARTSTPGFGGIIASIAFIFIYLIKRKGGALECE
ncbi:MAG: DUF11 domain-containing protein [Desulfobacterium sp.]|nr:DUF11 domain-containing protein [Desulfobacterium sp.]MBU3967168.1 DUF11 domain-containing protein [Euryarchaeota archaeon]MBU4037454.1 DUF11 domain-containing protein [Pseudomonadota bacterium]